MNLEGYHVVIEKIKLSDILKYKQRFENQNLSMYSIAFADI